jgi:hypothetical protein
MDQQTLDAMAKDMEFQESTLTRVHREETEKGLLEGWTIQDTDGWCLFIRGTEFILPPKVGETLRTYGKGFGYPVRGIMVGGRVFSYETSDQMDASHEAERASQDAKKKAAFEAGLPEFNAKIAALPAPFRERMEEFLATSPDWGWKMGGYELFVCTEAAKIVSTIPTPEGIKAFYNASQEEQNALVPSLEYGQHSGNTFGSAVRLAHLFCEDENLIPKMHAAICSLVGCKDAGCFASRKATAPAVM